ncbi:MAG: cation transporter [Oceanospirillaceae bacterium]|nr:cation transporter [Oceanospirillaceae bacterium]
MGQHHDHHHHHIDNYNRAFAIGLILNIGFVIVELIFGYLANSMALIADAWHNLSDVAGLLLAWLAYYMGKKAANQRYTYGFRRASILASLFSALLLLFALGGISWEALQRLQNPQDLQSGYIIWVAAIGFIINTATALLFVKGQHHDLNLKGAYLHMAADAAVSIGVVISGILISFTHWLWLDPVVSLIIVLVILLGTWHLLKESGLLALDGVPEKIELEAVKNYLLAQPGVTNLHDLHVWALGTTDIAMTVHLEITDNCNADELLHKISHDLHDDFDIEHCTVQLESGNGHCHLNRPNCVH